MPLAAPSLMDTNPAPAAPGNTIDPSSEDALRPWAEHFGVTIEQMQEAVQAAGTDPDAVRRHLLDQGASAGAG